MSDAAVASERRETAERGIHDARLKLRAAVPIWAVFRLAAAPR